MAIACQCPPSPSREWGEVAELEHWREGGAEAGTSEVKGAAFGSLPQASDGLGPVEVELCAWLP